MKEMTKKTGSEGCSYVGVIKAEQIKWQKIKESFQKAQEKPVLVLILSGI